MALVPHSKLVHTEGPSETLYSTPSVLRVSGNKKCKQLQTRGEKNVYGLRTYLGDA